MGLYFSIMKSYELRDNQWDAIDKLFPEGSENSQPGYPHRQILNSIFLSR